MLLLYSTLTILLVSVCFAFRCLKVDVRACVFWGFVCFIACPWRCLILSPRRARAKERTRTGPLFIVVSFYLNVQLTNAVCSVLAFRRGNEDRRGARGGGRQDNRTGGVSPELYTRRRLCFTLGSLGKHQSFAYHRERLFVFSWIPELVDLKCSFSCVFNFSLRFVFGSVIA